MRLLHSGSKAHYRGDSRSYVRILMFMCSLPPLQTPDSWNMNMYSNLEAPESESQREREMEGGRRGTPHPASMP